MVAIEQVNCFFNNNHSRIKGLAKFYLSKRKVKFIEVDALISHSYLNIIDKIDSINKEDIEPFTIHFLKTHAIWLNKVTLEERIIETKTFKIIQQEENLYNVEQDIMTESIEQVYANERDQIKIIIHDVYFKKKITTVRAMARHFNISQPSAHLLIKQLKTDINEQFKIKRRIYEQIINS